MFTATTPVPTVDAKSLLHDLAALAPKTRIAEAVRLVTTGTDPRAVAAALLPAEQHQVVDRVDATTQRRLVEAGFSPMASSNGSETVIGHAALVTAFQKSPVPEVIAMFVAAHAFGRGVLCQWPGLRNRECWCVPPRSE